MNHLIFNRTLWAKAAVPFCVFFLARFLFIINLPPLHRPSALYRPNMGSESPRHVKPMRAAAVVKASVAPPIIVAPVPESSSLMSLRSTLHDYNYTFSGNVTCGGQPCAAEIHVFIQSDHNLDFKQVFSTTPEGRFESHITLQESRGVPSDWRLVAYTPRTYPQEVRGRQILTDDPDIAVVRTLQLP